MVDTASCPIEQAFFSLLASNISIKDSSKEQLFLKYSWLDTMTEQHGYAFALPVLTHLIMVLPFLPVAAVSVVHFSSSKS